MRPPMSRPARRAPGTGAGAAGSAGTGPAAGGVGPAHWVRLFALGTGYMSTQVVWALYNAYLPLFYGRFLASNTLIGLIMTIDNIAAVTVQPYFGALSDRVHTRLGRRMPFLLAGIPLTAAFLVLIPRAGTLATLLLATLLMNVGIGIYSSPAGALMPDVTPPRLRASGNGIIMFMGGVGALLAIFVLSPLFRRSPVLPFDSAALLLLVSLAVVWAAVPEGRLARLGTGSGAGTPGAGPGAPAGEAPPERGRLLLALRAVWRAPDRSGLWLLLAGLAWVAAVNGAQNMFTRYGTERLGLDEVGATYMLGYFAGPFILFSIPAGILGDLAGRLRALRAGSLGIVAAFTALAFEPGPAVAPLWFALAGLCWALLMTNAYPILVNLAPAGAAGTYTGLWNLAIALAGLISPPLYGAAVDALGWRAFFPVGIVFLLVALVFAYRITPAAAAAGMPAAARRRGV